MSGLEDVSKRLISVYRALQDEQSRDLFMGRMRWMLDGDLGPLFDSIASAIRHTTASSFRPSRWLQAQQGRSVSEFFQRGDWARVPVVLYGAGDHYHAAVRLLNQYDLNVLCLCDGDEKKWSSRLNGLEILSPPRLCALPRDVCVIITAFHYGEAVNRDLKKYGFPEENIYWLLSPEMHYFGPEFLQPLPGEFYVDCGVWKTDTIEDFIAFCGGRYERIFAFEPDARSFGRIVSNLAKKNIARVDVVNKGVWSSNGTVAFSNHPTVPGMSAVNPLGPELIEVTTIDHAVGDAKVTFIKMDIEGAELEALRGARNTIKRNKPRLAISIYHKPEDIIDIPAYILDLAPEYKLYIRQYSYFSGETVLYAIL